MIEYSIDTAEQILYCNISEEVRLFDFTEYVKNLVADDKFNVKLNTIIKIEENTKISYANEAAGIGEFFSHFILQRKGVAWAFVMKSQITMGLARLIMDEVDTSPITVEYFFTEEEAKEWMEGLALNNREALTEYS